MKRLYLLLCFFALGDCVKPKYKPCKHFECNNEECLDELSSLCDGVDDCGDWSDEPPKLAGNLCPPCGYYMFRCWHGLCIPRGHNCGWYHHYVYQTDKTTKVSPACPKGEFKCVSSDHGNFSSGECILAKLWCDSKMDCSDGSDEANCSLLLTTGSDNATDVNITKT